MTYVFEQFEYKDIHEILVYVGDLDKSIRFLKLQIV